MSALRTTLLSTMISVVLFSCGNIPLSPVATNEGSLVIRTQFIKTLAKQTGTLETSFDSLIVEITASDISIPIRKSITISKLAPAITDTVSSIPCGNSRSVTIWTKSKSGIIIHRDSIPSHIVSIEAGRCVSLNALLLPAAGSIYIQLGNVPSNIDSLRAKFTSKSGQTWRSTVKRSARVYISMDMIPHGTEGTLIVDALDAQGATLFSSQTSLIFDAFKMENITLNFSSGGGSLSVNTTILSPAATVASGSFSSQEVTSDESGQCLITEIMYAANDSEYIEIFNPCSTSKTYDTLTVEIDGTKRLFTNITIAAGDYYVLGRKPLPWSDQSHPTASALDLSSNGNWITLKSRNQILDQVVFSDGTTGLEWPSISGKKSIELDKAHCSAKDNNFGRYWLAATSIIATTTNLYGTPGT